jgi:hypothetical protein
MAGAHQYDEMASGKVPPSWCPERDKEYPLRFYIQDLKLWELGCDLAPEKRGPVAALRLTGGAKALVRELDAQILAWGQLQPQVSGIDMLIRALSYTYAPLQQELQIFVLSEHDIPPEGRRGDR